MLYWPKGNHLAREQNFKKERVLLEWVIHELFQDSRKAFIFVASLKTGDLLRG